MSCESSLRTQTAFRIKYLNAGDYMNGGFIIGILGVATSLLTIIGVIVKISMDYAGVKNSVDRIETKTNEDFAKIRDDFNKEIEDIQIDFEKDVKNIEASHKQDISTLTENIKSMDQAHVKEINRLKDEITKDREYTHESFVKITKEQQETAETLKEVSIVLKSFENTIGQRLTSLERKIDSITTIKVVEDA